MPFEEKPWDKLTPATQLRLFHADDWRVPDGWVPPKRGKRGKQAPNKGKLLPWEQLSFNSRVSAYYKGDPRVPKDWKPILRRTSTYSPEAVIVTLTPFLLELSEAELWEFLHDSWDRNGITPQSVIFRTPAGQNVITLPVTYDPV